LLDQTSGGRLKREVTRLEDSVELEERDEARPRCSLMLLRLYGDERPIVPPAETAN
jgi:hypothetical protein